MSIWASFFSIEDERQWIEMLRTSGIKAGIIREGDAVATDLDAPYVYTHSGVLPAVGGEQNGFLELAYIPAHVRFWRDNPEADVELEPETPWEPWMRVMVSPRQGVDPATVVLHRDQVLRLNEALTEWIAESDV